MLETLTEIATAVGAVMLAAAALMVALRGLAKVLEKLADLTATPKDNEVLAEIVKGLDKAIAWLRTAADYSRALLPKGPSK